MSEKNINQNDVKENTTAPEKSGFMSKVTGVFATLWRWTKRMVMGPSKELDVMAVENLESPTKLAIKNFFRRKVAVIALVVLICMFLFVFIGSLFFPINLNYTDALQGNIAPTYSMLKVPKDLKNNVKLINGFANFTIGVSNDNTLYMWGYTKDALTKQDIADFPE